MDASGSAYVTGNTGSGSFPTTVGAFDTTHNSDDNALDVFVTKFNPAGSALVYSTFLGGSETEIAPSIALDTSGNAYVIGSTTSPNFPTTAGAFDTTHNNNFDVFVTKLNPSGSAPLVYSTFLGGISSDFGNGIAVDSSGSAYVTGGTTSSNFPTTVGAFDTTQNRLEAFVTKLNPSGAAPLVYSTFLGGVELDTGEDVDVDIFGSAYVTGFTVSPDFPTTVDAFDTTHNGSVDVFVTKLNPSGSAPLDYSTFLGGSGEDLGFAIALDIFGSAYVTGFTRLPIFPPTIVAFPTTVGAFDTTHNGAADAFVAKLSPIVFPSFDVCFKDDGNGDSFQFNSTTGEYSFTQSNAGGLTLTGTGELSQQGCLLVLEDNQSGRRVKAHFNQCNNKGQAVIQIESERKRTFVITDKDTSDSNCANN